MVCLIVLVITLNDIITSTPRREKSVNKDILQYKVVNYSLITTSFCIWDKHVFSYVPYVNIMLLKEELNIGLDVF